MNLINNDMNPTDRNNLGIEEKIGQLVMPRIDLNNPGGSLPLARKLVNEAHVGGFIIFGGTRDSVKRATEELQAVSQIPLFFACDAERGVGQIVSDMTLFPFTMSLGAIDDKGLVYTEASLIAEEMGECGLNLAFGPVTDVNTNPGNPIINIRSYGDDPVLVSRLSQAFIKGLQENGVLSCAKHFPGHGGTRVDSHVDMPVSNQSVEDLFACDLVPFQNAVDSGVTFIMPAHIAYPEISREKIPATISGAVIKGILREKLGFNGLVVTDSFRMDGIGKSGGEADMSRLALMSGCDVILDPKDPGALVRRLTRMADSGDLDSDTLMNSVRRIIGVKNKWLTGELSESKDIKKDRYSLVKTIAKRSPCLLKGGAVESGNALVYVFDVTDSGRDIAAVFLNKMTDSGISCKKCDASSEDTEAVNGFLEEFDAVICLIYTTVGAWKKESFVPENYRTILKALETLPKEKVLVSFGSPYVVSEFMAYDTVLCMFDSMGVCQVAAADVLLGKLEARGTVPVNL